MVAGVEVGARREDAKAVSFVFLGSAFVGVCVAEDTAIMRLVRDPPAGRG